MSEQLRAFAVTEPSEGAGGIVFTKDNLNARKLGANEWNEGELRGMRVIRAPWADNYPKGVPASLMVAHGWHFECCFCGATIDEYFLDENNLSSDEVVGTQFGKVFCSPKCEADHLEYEEQRTDVQNRALDILKSLVSKRFGSVKFAEREHAYACKQDGVWLVHEATVRFEYDGMTIGPASLGFSHFPSRFIGPRQPKYRVPHGDVDAFEAFAMATMGACHD